MKKTMLFLLLWPALVFSQVQVDSFRLKTDGRDWAPAIQRALNYIDSVGQGSVEFTGTSTYKVFKNIELPRYSKNGRRIIILNGNGCKIVSRDSVYIFNRIPANQKEALDKMMSTRFTIRDFTFQGGSKAINLGATYGSTIENCEFLGQKEAAADLQFALNSEIHHCNSTGAGKDNFILRTGEDWGGTGNNSQSNHSVISMCRVYTLKGANTGYKILGSGGCVVRDCIAEGSHEIDYSIYFDRQGSTTVRLFTVQNLHLENTPQKAGIYLRNTGIAVIDGLFYQTARENYPLVLADKGAEQVTLKNVPHYVNGTVLQQENNEVVWLLEDCHKSFLEKANWRVKNKNGEYEKKHPFYFRGRASKYQVNQTVGGK